MLDRLETSLVTAVDAAGTTARISAYGNAVNGVTARDETDDLTDLVGGGTAGGTLSPAAQYKVSVTGCIDCNATDFDALRLDETTDPGQQLLLIYLTTPTLTANEVRYR